MDRRCIEHNIPLSDISHFSAKEKVVGSMGYGHPSMLHVWWARRPLVSSRATIYASLLGYNKNHEDKFNNSIKKLLELEVSKNKKKKFIKEIQKEITKNYSYSPKILDPFSGGGSIPFEALRSSRYWRCR